MYELSRDRAGVYVVCALKSRARFECSQETKHGCMCSQEQSMLNVLLRGKARVYVLSRDRAHFICSQEQSTGVYALKSRATLMSSQETEHGCMCSQEPSTSYELSRHIYSSFSKKSHCWRHKKKTKKKILLLEKDTHRYRGQGREEASQDYKLLIRLFTLRDEE